ncbi:MAG: winged helix-turn-helix domain-containing protein [Anaerolineae bacterium]
MSPYTSFSTSMHYGVPLLETLTAMPGGQATRREVLTEFEPRHADRIRATDRADVASGGVSIWSKWVDWWRYYLIQYGFADAPAFGVWRITDAGRRWLEENPDSILLSRPRPAGPRKAKMQKTSSAAGQKHKTAKPGKRSQSAAADDAQVRILRREIDGIRLLLAGRSQRPSDERLCDLVLFCYTLELYEEASALFALVDRAGVNSWQYDRSRKLALVSAQKSASARAEGSHRR